MTTDTTTTAPAPAHVVQVVSDGFEYLAECGCGWASEWHFTPAEADEAGTEHIDGTVPAPDHVDVLLTALLDIQDDLAAVVIWLAENWSTSLPSLGWTSCGSDRDRERPALRVLAYVEPAEFAAAAAVIDGAVTDEPSTDAGHASYRHAVRDFGRVRLDVFTVTP